MTIKTLETYKSKVNLLEDLDENEINTLTGICISGFEADLQSRDTWESEYSKWIKLATQVAESKTWPWRNAANVKYPLVATAAMQFAARAYPALVPDNKVVAMRVIGEDPQSEKRKRADRISQHMSYQLLEEMPNWRYEMDKLCYILPIIGICFKKTYRDFYDNKNCSNLVFPKDFVVDYWTTDLEKAYRKTHVLYMTENEIRERQNKGLYLPSEKYTPSKQYKQVTILHDESLNRQQNTHGFFNLDNSITIPMLEVHTWYDLDDDGYEEPYIITIDWVQRKAVRMVAGYDLDGVEFNGNQIISIKQNQYFTKFEFLPNPDGGFYSLGFGALLGPLNDTVNTIINQLLDSGTLYNLQAGFLSKGLRIKGGNQDFSPGEWKYVNPIGDDLRKGIFPLPVREPSKVLFELLGTIVESGNKLASVAQIFVGEMPGQNTPATTTMATIEQGMKVFTAIYKRIYESLRCEFKKLYNLNKKFLDGQEEFVILDSQTMGQVTESDYAGDDTDIKPAGDPKAIADAQKLLKAQAIMELMKMGTIDPKWATMKMADAMGIDDIQDGIMQQPPPDPEQQKMQMEAQLKQQEAQMKAQLDQAKMAMEQEKQYNELMMRSKEHEMDMRMKEMELHFKQVEAELDIKKTQMETIADIQNQHAQHQQKMRMAEEEHQVKQKKLNEKESELSKKKKRTKIKEGADGSFEVIDEVEDQTPTNSPKKKYKVKHEKDGSYSVESD